MKRIVSICFAILALSFSAKAQDETLAPVIYSAIDGNAEHLVYANGTAISSSSNIIVVPLQESTLQSMCILHLMMRQPILVRCAGTAERSRSTISASGTGTDTIAGPIICSVNNRINITYE